MISLEQALAQLSPIINQIGEVETRALEESLNRVAAENIYSPMDMPMFDNSAIDGYALRIDSDERPPLTLPVSQRITAGEVGDSLLAGSAVRIFTGAEIPLGANCIAYQEYCEGGIDNLITINQFSLDNDNIRYRGQDMRVGSLLIEKGARLKAHHIGLLATIGRTELLVYRPIKVAVVTTGNELMEIGSPLQQGSIYNSNKYLVSELCKQAHFTIVSQNWVEDNLSKIKQVLHTSAQEADVVLSCGGVSVGEEDHVKAAIEKIGSLKLWKIAIKPGKPIAIGTINPQVMSNDQDKRKHKGKGTHKECLFIGLPGNPVSAYITFQLIAKPLIEKLQGQVKKPITKYSVVSEFTRTVVKRMEFLRVSISSNQPQVAVELCKNQSSSNLNSLGQCDGLVVQEINQTINKGDMVQFIPLSSLHD